VLKRSRDTAPNELSPIRFSMELPLQAWSSRQARRTPHRMEMVHGLRVAERDRPIGFDDMGR
jgi:hypothetical protein